MTITTITGDGISSYPFPFSGPTVYTEEDFPYKLYSFIIKPWRDHDKSNGFKLRDLLEGPQELFKDIYNKSEEIRALYSYKNCHKDLLIYLDNVLSLLESDIPDLNTLSEYDHRNAIKMAANFWRYRGTARGYSEILSTFTSSPYKILQWPFFRPIESETYFGYLDDGEDFWLLDKDSTTPDTHWSHLRVVDPGYEDLNRSLVEAFVKLNLNSAEWCTIRYLFFLELCRDFQQWDKISGGTIVSNEFIMAEGDFLQTDVVRQNEWDNYAVKFRVKGDHSGVLTSNLSSLELQFYAQDQYNYYSLKVNPSTGVGTLDKRFTDLESNIASITYNNFEEDYYATFVIEIESGDHIPNTYVKVYQDGLPIKVFTAVGTTFTKGKIGLRVGTSGADDTRYTIGEVEVYPLREYNNKAMATFVGPDIITSPSAATMNLTVWPTFSFKEFTIVGGFGGFSVSAELGDIFFLRAEGSFYKFTYLAPTSGTSDTITVTDEQGQTKTIAIALS